MTANQHSTQHDDAELEAENNGAGPITEEDIEGIYEVEYDA